MRSVAWKTVILGLIASAGGCSSAPAGGSRAPAESVGTVGMELTLPAGIVINQVAYTIGGPSSYSGTVDVSASSEIELGIGNVAPGTGYVLSETAASVDGTVVCSGASAPFAVIAGQTTAVNVALACTTSPDSGAIVGTTIATECATWTSALATPNETSVGGVVQINATATAPDASALTFTWTASAGAIDTPNQAGANFTCPATPGAVTLTLTVGDGPIPAGGACPASDTTTTLTVTCDPIDTGTDAGAVDSGAADAGSTATVDSSAPAPDAAPVPPLPCTVAGQTGCVACSGNASGVCSPTEALIVQQDINAGSAATTPCYSCLFNAGCIDDTVFGDQGNECGDLGAASQAACLSTLSCILGTSCGATSVAACYCGTAPTSGSCTSGGANGACEAQEAAGLGFAPTDGLDILKNFTSTTLASGVANQLAQCALSNLCNVCLQ